MVVYLQQHFVSEGISKTVDPLAPPPPTTLQSLILYKLSVLILSHDVYSFPTEKVLNCTILFEYPVLCVGNNEIII